MKRIGYSINQLMAKVFVKQPWLHKVCSQLRIIVFPFFIFFNPVGRLAPNYSIFFLLLYYASYIYMLSQGLVMTGSDYVIFEQPLTYIVDIYR